MYEDPRVRKIVARLKSEIPGLMWGYFRDQYTGDLPNSPRRFMPTNDVTLQYITPIGSSDNGIWVVATKDEVKTFHFLEATIEYLQSKFWRAESEHQENQP